MSTFRLPDLGEGLEEAEIVAWHAGEGDHVIADQPLVSVETDKAVVEIPRPARAASRHAATGGRATSCRGAQPLVEFAEAAGRGHGHRGGRDAGGAGRGSAAAGAARPRRPGGAGGARPGAAARGRPRARAPHGAGGHRQPGRRRGRGRRGCSGAGPSRCAASAAPWRRTWRGRTPRSFRPPSPTTPTSAAGPGPRTSPSAWCGRSSPAAAPSPP